jgi:hypothetical protein
MGVRAATAVLVATIALAGLGATLAACFDLFHATGDVVTACALDAQTPGCGPPAQETGTGAGSDFCAWSHADALAHARHACAWLGACATPKGRNAFGTCMVQALLNYDCAANPNHRSKGTTHDLWDCLSRVQTCGDVSACVFPPGAPTGDDAGGTCTQRECYGSELRWCTDAGDVGIDCAGNGAQRCGGFPSAGDAQWLACVAEGDGGTCTPSKVAQCSAGFALSCPSGVPETIDCRALLGTPGSCVAGQLVPEFDWTGPCAVTPPLCTADSCADGGVTGCARGAPFWIDCAKEKLGACRMVTTDVGAAQHAACTAP